MKLALSNLRKPPMNAPVAGLTALGLTLQPLTPTVGVEIHGVDLSQPVSDDVLSAIRRALLDYKVVFFREQHITTEQHLDFARRFGELEVHPFAPHKEGYPEVLAITHNRESRGRENTWHSDVTWREVPSLGSILRALEVPPVGGDTLFADMVAAYAGLSDAIKEEIEGKVAVHDFAHFRRGLRKAGKSEEEIESSTAASPGSNIPWCAPTRRPASAPSTSTPPSPSTSSASARSAAASFSPTSTPRRRSRNTSAASAGRRLDRLLGQPLQPALRGERLLAGGAADGAGDGSRGRGRSSVEDLSPHEGEG